MKIFCIIPAYNEAASLARVIAKVKPLVSQVVVVDDGSKDQSSQVAQQAGAIVIRHIINRGQGAALQTGNHYAQSQGADIIVHFDADDQFLAEEIPSIISPLIKGEADIVFGSRFLDKQSAMPLVKKWLIMPIAKLINRLLGVKTTDPQNGFRALSRQAALKIIIDNDGMAHCSEILHKAVREKLRIKEVPITVIYHRFGNNLGGGVRIVKDLIIKKIIK